MHFFVNDIINAAFRSGDRIVIKDTSDPDWWIGSVAGYTGYFPHRYVLPLERGQRVYQIVKPLHLGNGLDDVKLLRDQAGIPHDSIHTSIIMIITSYRTCRWCLRMDLDSMVW